jgi:hypothetical protein
MNMQIGDLYRRTRGYGASRNVIALITNLIYDKPTKGYVVVYELYGDVEYVGETSSMMKDVFTSFYDQI